GCCSGVCTSLATIQNCGYCGNTCTGGLACCTDPRSGTTSCTDTRQDPAHCGACGRSCPAGQHCCNSVCSSLTTTQNCGVCGNTCSPTMPCCVTNQGPIGCCSSSFPTC